jgi:hypothetical protein
VIFGGHPKDWYGRYTCFAQFARSLQGAKGFVNGIRGSSKQADLLAANDGNSARLQKLQVGFGFRTAAKRAILLAEDFRDFFSAGIGEGKVLGVFKDGLEVRRVGKEAFYFGEILEVITDELRRVRKLARE